jgi:hypothetical protein
MFNVRKIRFKTNSFYLPSENLVQISPESGSGTALDPNPDQHPDPHSSKMLDPDPYPHAINADPKHWIGVMCQ